MVIIYRMDSCSYTRAVIEVCFGRRRHEPAIIISGSIPFFSRVVSALCDTRCSNQCDTVGFLHTLCIAGSDIYLLAPVGANTIERNFSLSYTYYLRCCHETPILTLPQNIRTHRWGDVVDILRGGRLRRPVNTNQACACAGAQRESLAWQDLLLVTAFCSPSTTNRRCTLLKLNETSIESHCAFLTPACHDRETAHRLLSSEHHESFQVVTTSIVARYCVSPPVSHLR